MGCVWVSVVVGWDWWWGGGGGVDGGDCLLVFLVVGKLSD